MSPLFYYRLLHLVSALSHTQKNNMNKHTLWPAKVILSTNPSSVGGFNQKHR